MIEEASPRSTAAITACILVSLDSFPSASCLSVLVELATWEIVDRGGVRQFLVQCSAHAALLPLVLIVANTHLLVTCCFTFVPSLRNTTVWLMFVHSRYIREPYQCLIGIRTWCPQGCRHEEPCSMGPSNLVYTRSFIYGDGALIKVSTHADSSRVVRGFVGQSRQFDGQQVLAQVRDYIYSTPSPPLQCCSTPKEKLLSMDR